MSAIVEAAEAQQILDMLADGETIADLSRHTGIPEDEIRRLRNADRNKPQPPLQDQEARQELWRQIKEYQFKRNPLTNKFFTQKAVGELFGTSTAQVGKIWRTPENAAHVSAHMPDQASWRIRVLYQILMGRYSASELAQLNGVSRVQITLFVAYLRKALGWAIHSTDAGKNSVFYSPDFTYNGDSPNPITASGFHAEPVPPPAEAGEDLPPVVTPKEPAPPKDHYRTISPNKAQLILEMAGHFPMPRVAELTEVDVSTVCYLWQGRRRKTLYPSDPIAQKYLEHYRAQHAAAAKNPVAGAANSIAGSVEGSEKS